MPRKGTWGEESEEGRVGTWGKEMKKHEIVSIEEKSSCGSCEPCILITCSCGLVLVTDSDWEEEDFSYHRSGLDDRV